MNTDFLIQLQWYAVLMTKAEYLSACGRRSTKKQLTTYDYPTSWKTVWLSASGLLFSDWRQCEPVAQPVTNHFDYHQWLTDHRRSWIQLHCCIWRQTVDHSWTCSCSHLRHLRCSVYVKSSCVLSLRSAMNVWQFTVNRMARLHRSLIRYSLQFVSFCYSNFLVILVVRRKPQAPTLSDP